MQELNSEAIAMAFAQLISKRRDLLDLTQAELAARMGVSREVVVNVETGRQEIFLDQLAAFAKALECTTGDLMPSRETVGTPDASSIAWGGLTKNGENLVKHLASYGSGKGNYLPGRESKSKR